MITISVGSQESERLVDVLAWHASRWMYLRFRGVYNVSPHILIFRKLESSDTSLIPQTNWTKVKTLQMKVYGECCTIWTDLLTCVLGE